MKVITQFIRHVHEPCSIFHVTKPLTVYARRIDQYLLRSTTLYLRRVILTGGRPHFTDLFSHLQPIRQETRADPLFMKPVYTSLSPGLYCAVHICIYKLKKQPKINGKMPMTMPVF